MRYTLEFASAPPGNQIPSSGWWSDRALRRDSGSGVFPTGPLSRRATTPPNHRADEPPSARAPGKRAHLVRTGPNDHSRRTARMRCPDTAVFRLLPPLVTRPLTALGHSQWPEPPGFADATATSPAAVRQLKSYLLRAIRRPDRCGRVRAVRDSPSDIAACHRVVRRHTCSPVTRRSTRATQARAAPGAHVGQPAPKTPSSNQRELALGTDAGCLVLSWNHSKSTPCLLVRHKYRHTNHHAAASLPFKFLPAPLGARHDTNATHDEHHGPAMPTAHSLRRRANTRGRLRGGFFVRVVVVVVSSVVRSGRWGTTPNAPPAENQGRVSAPR